MAPPIPPSGGGIPPGSPPQVSISHSGRATTSSETAYVAAPTLNLQSDPNNLLRSDRRIATTGDALDVVVQDFVTSQLREGGRGAQIVQLLGSFPGNINPDLPAAEWDPDKRIDLNVMGEAEVMLRRLAPRVGWNQATLESNLALAREGMVYYNLAMETPQGPIPFKMGILDQALWNQSFQAPASGEARQGPRGFPYLGLRSSLLPITGGRRGTYRFLGQGESVPLAPPSESGIGLSQSPAASTQERFFNQLRQVQADYMGHALDSFHGGEDFTGEQLAARRYNRQFMAYDFWRKFIEFHKGRKQRRRYGDMVPEILAPALREALLTDGRSITVQDGEGRVISPQEITPENFNNLTFIQGRSREERRAAWQQVQRESSYVGRENRAQTGRNIASNGTIRPGPHRPNWFTYGARKFGLGPLMGSPGQLYPRYYTPESSFFLGRDPLTLGALSIDPAEHRLGRRENPVNQLIYLMGYGPGDENNPRLYHQKVAGYTEAEIAAGKDVNTWIGGNHLDQGNKAVLRVGPSEIPLNWYRFMDALESPVIKDIVVVGTPDTLLSLESFLNAPYLLRTMAEGGAQTEVFSTVRQVAESRGKTFIPVPEGGGFGANVSLGINNLPRQGEMGILSYGDTPRVNLHDMANHPWRHSMDYFFGSNAEPMLLDRMGMNFHYQGEMDGVHYPLKEGNVQGVRSMPPGLWDEMFDNRKSVKSGPLGKVWIFFKYLFGRPYHPNFVDVPHLLGSTFLSRSLRGILYRLAGRRTPKVAASIPLVEEVMSNRLGWKIDIRPFNTNPGSTLDIDGISDRVKNQILDEVQPQPFEAELAEMARQALVVNGSPETRDAEGNLIRLPSNQETNQRFNDLIVRMHDSMLEREGMRRGPRGRILGMPIRLGNRVFNLIFDRHWARGPVDWTPNGPTRLHVGSGNPLRHRFFNWALSHTAGLENQERLGITPETLRAAAIDPNALPYLDNGELNPEYLERVMPDSDVERFRRAFTAYDERGRHAMEGAQEFQRIFSQEPRSYEGDARFPSRVENFVLNRLNVNPEGYRAGIVAWHFNLVEEALVAQAQRRFGEGSTEVDQVRDYFRESVGGTPESPRRPLDSPLRRVMLGMKAEDFLLRSQRHLSPAEYQTLYPHLAESIRGAQEAVAPKGVTGRLPGSRWFASLPKTPLRDGRFFLRGFFDRAMRNADQIYVHKVGESPPSYQEQGVGRFFPHSNSRSPIERDTQGNIVRVDSQAFRQFDLHDIAFRERILPSRIPHLIAAAAGAQNREGLARISSDVSTLGGKTLAGHQDVLSPRISAERLIDWIQTTEGQNYLRENRPWLEDSISNRMREGGVGLAAGIGSLLVFEHFADQLGLDPRDRPHERFMFVVGGSHLVGQGVGVASEVFLNRSLGAPFSFASTRTVSAGSETALQYVFESQSTTRGALSRSVFRNMAMGGGLLQNFKQGAIGLLYRTPMNMGAGLMSSVLADRVLSDRILGLEQGSSTRQAISFGAFFAPDVGRIAFGSRLPRFFQSGPMRFATRAFSYGFMADMAFLGGNRIFNGSNASRNNMIYQMAGQMRRDNAGAMAGLAYGVGDMLAPSLTNWWASVNWTLSPNEYQNRAEQQLQEFSSATDTQVQNGLRTTFLQGQSGEHFDASFYTHVNYDFLRGENRLSGETSGGRALPTQDLAESLLRNPRFTRRFQSLETTEEQIDLLRHQYRGWSLSRSDVENMMAQVSTHQLRNDLAQLHQVPLLENQANRNLFDESGSLRSGQEEALLSRVFGDESMSESRLVAGRRMILVSRILRMREETHAEEAGELSRLEVVAGEIGLMDSDGELRGDQQIVQEASEQFAVWQAGQAQEADTITPEDNEAYQLENQSRSLFGNPHSSFLTQASTDS